MAGTTGHDDGGPPKPQAEVEARYRTELSQMSRTHIGSFRSVFARCTAALGLLGAVVVSAPAQAAKLADADRTWIDRCIADRRASHEKPAALRAYCVCMQGIVGDNRPFGVTELERAYPPAHEMCWKRAGR